MDGSTQTTALALPEPTTLATMFKAENGLDPLLNKIRADALDMVKDLNPSSKKDRELMRSVAFKVSQSKAEIDRRGKELTEAQRKEVASVNAGRNVADTFLSTLRDQVKKPADDWEDKEEVRIDGHKTGLKKFDDGRVDSMSEPDLIQSMIDRAKDFHAGRAWDEYASQADEKLAHCVAKWQADLDAANLRISQAAELEALRAEKAVRDEADRLANEAAEAEAVRVRQAEIDAETARVAAVHDAARLAQIEADKLAAAKQAQEAAEAKAKADADQAAKDAADREAETAKRHADELAEALAATERAAQAERDRIAAEVQAEADARAQREADQAHRARIKSDISAALAAMAGAATPDAIAEALMAGKIPHTKVSM
jgi:hypothetical protein